MADKRKVSSGFRKYLKSELSFWQSEDIINSEQTGRISNLYQLDTLHKESVNTLYCSRLSFPVFKRPEYKNFLSVVFVIPADIFSAFGKSFRTPA